MTGEYLKAVNEQGLTYVQLKTLAHNSLEYAFLPGKSLWKEYQRLAPVDQCGTGAARGRRVSQPCRQFLQQNEKARMEWELESDFSEFEGRH